MNDAAAAAGDSQAVAWVSFAEAFRVWLKIGFISFGGPAGQIAVMHRIVVEEKKWLGEARFLHALNYCMLLPGPEAQQLATYIGWLLHRTAGGLAAGLLFVLPGAVVMLGLSMLYAGYGELKLVQAIFYGVKAAVLAVVIAAVIRIGQRALKNWAMISLAALSFVAIFFFTVPFPAIVAGAALIGFAGGYFRPDLFGAGAESGAEDGIVDRRMEDGQLDDARPTLAGTLKTAAIWLTVWLLPVALLFFFLGPADVFAQEAFFFCKMAVVTFGGAYAVLAYVAQQAVEVYGWLAPGEMLDGLGLAETTPGPLIMVVQFVGFLGAFRNPGGLDPMLAGVIGAGITTWVTFAPCFMWIFLGAPFIEALRGRRSLSAALSAITAAVVGVILNLAIWFALNITFGEVTEIDVGAVRLLAPTWQTLDPISLALTLAALLAMLRFKAGMIPTLLGAAVLGVAWAYLGA